MKFASFTSAESPETDPVDIPRHPGAVTRFRTLSGAEEGVAMAGAYEYAKGRGVEAPASGDSLYDLGFMAHVLARAAVDVDTPRQARGAFFADQKEVLDRLHADEIAYLFERQELHQSQHSPYTRSASFEEILDTATKAVKENSSAPFLRLSPATRATSWLILAGLVVSFREPKSQAGSLSAVSGTS